VTYLEMAARQVLERAKRCPPAFALPEDRCCAYGCAVSPNRSFVLVAKMKTVVRVDLATRKVTHTYKGFKGANGVALTPDGLEAVVADYRGSRVGRIQLATGRVDFPFGGDDEFNDVAVADDGSFALATNWGNGTVGWIDLLSNNNHKKGTRPKAYSGFKDPRGVAISPDRACALVACDGDNTVRRLELATGTVTAVFEGFKGP
jgi:DNA-binding beta-propeller fold protein YncE